MLSIIGDIRNADIVRKSIAEFRPEIVIHMAAQSLVRKSYTEPVVTYATNVMGTVHVLEGEGTFSLEGEDIEMKPGVVIFMEKNAVHSLKAHKNTCFLLTLHS